MKNNTKDFIAWLESQHCSSLQDVSKRLSYASFVGKQGNYVFVETPKAACSTLKRILAELEGHNIVCTQVNAESSAAMCIHNRKFNPMKSLSKCTAKTIKNLFENPDSVRFCVVRNPYARIASAWADKIRQREPGYAFIWKSIASYCGHDPSVCPSFGNFVKFVTDNHNVANCNLHWRGMTYLLLPELVKYTHILRTETLAADLAQIFGIIAPGVDAQVMLKAFRTNESLPIDWQAYYDEETAERVAKFYKEDFQLFGYSLDSWRKRGTDEEKSKDITVEALKRELLVLETKALEAIRNRNDVIHELVNRNKEKKPSLKKYPSILVLGDSHTSVFNKPQWKARTPFLNWDVVSVEGATLSGLQNPKSKIQAGSIFQEALTSKSAKVIVFLLGEVDTGFVIWRRSERDGVNVYESAQQALESYKNMIQQARNKASVIVISTPLPALRDNRVGGKVANVRRPVHASQIDRTTLTCWFNREIELWCIDLGISYINLDRYSKGKDGLVREKLMQINLRNYRYDPVEYMMLLEEHFLPVVRQHVNAASG